MYEEITEGNNARVLGGLVNSKPLIFTFSKNTLNYKILGESNTMVQLPLPELGLDWCYTNLTYESLVVNQNKIWVLGQELNQFISLGQPLMEGPMLPFTTIVGHSMVQIDTKTIYIIGGWQDQTITEETWVIDPSNNYDLKPGPSLKQVRHCHSCATMVLKGKKYIVIAGGYTRHHNIHHGDSTTVEILDTSNPVHGWMEGMY